MVTVLAQFNNEQWPIRGTVTKTVADFRRTHLDTWEFQKLLFSEDQLEVIDSTALLTLRTCLYFPLSEPASSMSSPISTLMNCSPLAIVPRNKVISPRTFYYNLHFKFVPNLLMHNADLLCSYSWFTGVIRFDFISFLLCVKG